MDGDRFIVVAVAGATVTPTAGRGGGTRLGASSYSVLDTVDACREVGQFYVASSVSSGLMRRKAGAFCDRLNAEERDYEQGFA